VKDHLSVGRRLADGAFSDEGLAQSERIGEVAVVAEREAAGLKVDEERLDVPQYGIAAGRVSNMANGHVAHQAVDHGA
jgi:hypothetical protein